MTHRHFAFNGDADGLCALQQLRLAEPGDATLVTGVKRDIHLVRRIDATSGDAVTVLDISLEQNRDDTLRLLEAGVSVRYFDHHRAGDMPRHPRFEAHIEEGPDVCTSALVDRYLGGRYRAWAAVAAFGDGLPGLGTSLAREAGVDAASTGLLQELGTRLNYNAYGEAVSDLHFDPQAVAQAMLPYADPLAFIRGCDVHGALGTRYDDDMRRARGLAPLRDVPGATIVMLPDEPWARRAIGVLANELTQARPECAIAILSPRAHGGFTVSVRAPAKRAGDAGAFCSAFPTGGGRVRAGGINHLPEEDVERFSSRFALHFGTH
jgi:hypothetical protein